MDRGIVIFGGTGDLTNRKLFPAFYNLHALGQLPDDFKILIIGRRDYDDEILRKGIRQWVERFARVPFEESAYLSFLERVFYQKVDLEKEDDYVQLQSRLVSMNLEKECMHYYAVAPEQFLVIAKAMRKVGCCFDTIKVIIEKPFGADLPSAKELYQSLSDIFNKENIYYIDHYLGKEMIINIMTLRFSNALFRGTWNAEFVDNIQINAFEKEGVGTRGGYYDSNGVLKDMVQNHLLQILTIVAMEEPPTMEAQHIKDSQNKVLKDIRMEEESQDVMILGQYEGYREEDKVSKDSQTPTYAALKLTLDNERWKGVPFYIRTGKEMALKESNVVVQFKGTKMNPEGDRITIHIQPVEGVGLEFFIKEPGTGYNKKQVQMEFCQSCDLENQMNTPEAYERLLYACMQKDRSLFSTWEQIESSWDLMDGLRENYKGFNRPLYTYKRGSWGPKQSDEWIEKDTRRWVNPEVY